MAYQYRKVIAAGTFDRLHNGHQQILDTALLLGKEVSCGLTTLEMNRKKVLAQTIQTYTKRENSLKRYFKWKNNRVKISIVPISDIYGPTLKENDIDAIITTPESADNVDKINQLRRERNFGPVEKIIVSLMAAEDRKKLSSTRIRLGQIDRQGKVFNQLFFGKNLVLPDSQRHYFKKPLGKLMKAYANSLSWLALAAKQEVNKKSTPMVITVGDIVTQSFLQAGVNFQLSIIDHYSRRVKLNTNFNRRLIDESSFCFRAVNKAGGLTANLIKTLKQCLSEIVFEKKHGILEIKGEEDLAVLPVVLLSPLQSLVYYGQPNQGIVRVRVTEKIKQKVYGLLSKFIASH